MELPPCFKTSFLNPRLKIVDFIGSTNAETKKLLKTGAEDGFILLAHSQSAGVGRKGRQWLSPKGGLYFSIVIPPPLGLTSAPILNLLTACAVCKQLRGLGIDQAHVKWPNDVLVDDAKISGILSEVVTDPTESVIIGVGLNLNRPVSQMPSGLEWATTSVIDEIGHDFPILEMLCMIVNEMDRYLAEVEETSSYAAMLEDWRRLSCTLGRQVRVHQEGSVIEGVAVDIASNGALIVDAGAKQIEVLMGDVHHLRSDE